MSEFELNLEGAGNEVAAEGEYLAVCINVEQGYSKNNNPMLTWRFTLLDASPAADVQLFTALTPQAMWKVAETTEALGLRNNGETKVSFDRDDAVGCYCSIAVTHRQGTQGDRVFLSADSVFTLSPERASEAKTLWEAKNKSTTSSDIPF